MIFTTEIEAIDPKDGQLKKWSGERIEANSLEEANNKIKDKGYLKITGEFVEEIDAKELFDSIIEDLKNI